jgi:hypothetical protein
MHPLRPYIGITDFTDGKQVDRMRKIFMKHVSPLSERVLHVGVMMSYKTLNDLETKWAKAFPHKDSIIDIFWSDNVFNCLHYADYDHSDHFALDLATAIVHGGKHLHGLQLDMVWPEPGEIFHAIQFSGMNPEIILQVGKNAIEAAHNAPTEVAYRLADYRGVVHRVLLDKSMGKGLGMDAVGLLPFARAIRDAFPDLGIGAAGGLGPMTMDLVTPLLAEFPDLSFDAQGRLRPSGNALDPIDWNMAAEYLRRAIECTQ